MTFTDSLTTGYQAQDLWAADELAGMIGDLKYKPGWRFQYLHPASLDISLTTVNSDPNDQRELRVHHILPLPPKLAYFSTADLRRYLLELVLQVETHEACEFFRLPKRNSAEYYAPFFPHGGDEERPYSIIDRTEHQGES